MEKRVISKRVARANAARARAGRASAKRTSAGMVQEQLALPLRRGRGGARPGSGRKRKADAVRHDARPEVTRHKPLHVSLRTHKAVGRLRRRDAYVAIRGAIATCLGRWGFRIVHVSIQAHHVHLLIEANGNASSPTDCGRS
jgi:hypothetical protein